LNDEADFGGDAEVTDDEEGNGFEEAVSIQFLFVSAQSNQILQLKRLYLHDIANVE